MTNDVGDEGLRNGRASDRAEQDQEDWNIWASVAPREAKWIERSPRSISLNLIRLASAADRNCCLGSPLNIWSKSSRHWRMRRVRLVAVIYPP